MSYDEVFSEWLDRYIRGREGYTRKAMFGGIGYLLNGNMCFGTLYKDLILRVGEEAAQAPLESGEAMVFDITGRPMKGWIMVSIDSITGDHALNDWLALAEAFVMTLPPKEDAASRPSNEVPVRQIRNLGKVSAGALQGIGIKTRADLERIGPVAAYIQIREQGGIKSLNLLYAMVAGLRDQHWTELTHEDKGELLRELDAWADMQQYIASEGSEEQ